MSLVRFATLCDKCGKRSEEYTAWPGCRECGEHVCPDCSTNPSEDEHNRADCYECLSVALAEKFEPDQLLDVWEGDDRLEGHLPQ